MTGGVEPLWGCGTFISSCPRAFHARAHRRGFELCPNRRKRTSAASTRACSQSFNPATGCQHSYTVTQKHTRPIKAHARHLANTPRRTARLTPRGAKSNAPVLLERQQPCERESAKSGGLNPHIACGVTHRTAHADRRSHPLPTLSSPHVHMCVYLPRLSQAPTVRNINLKYGSLSAFFAHLDADIVCMQVGV